MSSSLALFLPCAALDDAHRLWYQLTLALDAFLSLPGSAPYQIDLFREFVRDFDKHLNQLRLVDLGIRVAQRFTGALQRSSLTEMMC